MSKAVTGSQLESQVNELFETFNDIAKMLGKETVESKIANVTMTDDLKEVRLLFLLLYLMYLYVFQKTQ